MKKDKLYILKDMLQSLIYIERKMVEIKKIDAIMFSEVVHKKNQTTKKLIIDENKIYSFYGLVDSKKGIVTDLDGNEMVILKTNNFGKILPEYANVIQLGEYYVMPYSISDIDLQKLSSAEYNNLRTKYIKFTKSKLREKITQKQNVKR